MREVITRYGRNNIGFLWLFIEPIFFTIGVIILWKVMHSTSEFRLSIVPFVVTGYSCLLLWRTCSFRGIHALEANRSLLHHRQVKIQDIFIARMILDIGAVTASFIFLMGLMIAFNLMNFPNNLLLIIQGWILMAWLSACIGIIIGCLSELSDMVERIWHPLSYFSLSISGVFFMVEWLPIKVQELILWSPIIHPVEMVRAGYWGDFIKPHYSTLYIYLVCLCLTLITLLILTNKRLQQPN